MSEHQAIIFIISVIIITLMIWVGLGLFMDAHRESQKDDFLTAMNDIGATAVAYRTKIRALGGGGGEFIGFRLPANLSSIDAGSIFAVIEPNRILLVGHSRRGYGTISSVINDSGLVGNISVEGEF